MLREILRTPHSLVVLDEESRAIRRTRTAIRFETLDDVTAEYEAIACALDAIEHKTYAMLIDLRAAPPRNDEGYEAIALRYNGRLYVGFRKLAVLVLTAAGRLQVRRFLDATRVDGQVFTDEQKAHAFVAG